MYSLALFYFLIYFYICSHVQSTTDTIDPSKTLIWGPGLKPDKIVMRARYIFLQLVDKTGQNITESPAKQVVSSHLKGQTLLGSPCQIWTQVLDCKDGSFIIRYRVHNICFNFKITIRVGNTELPLKHLEFKGPIYEEECNCPDSSILSWLQNNDCQENNSQILQSLELFKEIDFNNLRDKIIARYNKPHSVSICHYVIESNKIYRKCYGQYVGFKSFVDDILLSLTRKVILPNVEFFINLGDWPLVPKGKEVLPIFSWCGSDDTNDIVIPTYDITFSSLEAMGRVMLDTLSVQGNTKLPWKNKINKVFWRGRDARRERLDLIDIARNHPDLFNASITNFFFFKDEKAKYGPGEKHTLFFNFFEYKYQLNIDGTVAAYRFPYLLAGDSLVFKQNSHYYEYFYKDLKAGMHFISIEKNLSNLVEKVKWAMNNDEEAYNITRKARQYARDNLMPQNIFCYHIALIHEWSKRLKSQVQILPEMERVPKLQYNCECITNEREQKDEL